VAANSGGALARLVFAIAVKVLCTARSAGERAAIEHALQLHPTMISTQAAAPTHLDLQLHHIAARGCAHQAGAHIGVLLVQGTNVARVLCGVG